jgi:hypothetical protein
MQPTTDDLERELETLRHRQSFHEETAEYLIGEASNYAHDDRRADIAAARSSAHTALASHYATRAVEIERTLDDRSRGLDRF